jgi:hypothetical protein
MAHGTDFAQRLCHGLRFVQLAVRPGLADQVERLLARLDALELQAFVNQLPNGFTALGGSLFQRAVAGLGQGDGQATHGILTLVFKHQFDSSAGRLRTGKSGTDSHSFLPIQAVFFAKTRCFGHQPTLPDASQLFGVWAGAVVISVLICTY